MAGNHTLASAFARKGVGVNVPTNLSPVAVRMQCLQFCNPGPLPGNLLISASIFHLVTFHFLQVPFAPVTITELNNVNAIRTFFTTSHGDPSKNAVMQKMGEIEANVILGGVT